MASARAGGITSAPLQKSPKRYFLPLSANGNQPKNGCQGAKDRKICSRIDADQDGVAKGAVNMWRIAGALLMAGGIGLIVNF